MNSNERESWKLQKEERMEVDCFSYVSERERERDWTALSMCCGDGGEN